MPRRRPLLLIAHNLVYGDGQARINLEIARRSLVRGFELHVVSVTIDDLLLKAGAIWNPMVVRRRPVLARIIQFASQVDCLLDQESVKHRRYTIIANGFTTTRPHDLNLCQFVHAAWLRAGIEGSSRGLLDWGYQQVYTRYNVRRERLAYAAARHVVVPSRRTAGELSSIGVPESKMEIIPNGVDLQEFHPASVDRAGMSLPAGVPLLLFVGDLRTNRKGLRYVLQAVVRLANVHLAVVGRVEGSPFPALAARLGIAERVRFLGFRRDVAQIMKACDLFVFPSTYEPFGMVVTEALASGLPVITTAVTGAAELLNTGCGTVLRDPTDVDALASAIQGWIATPGRISAARKACAEAVADHSWAAMADRYLDRFSSEESSTDNTALDASELAS